MKFVLAVMAAAMSPMMAHQKSSSPRAGSPHGHTPAPIFLAEKLEEAVKTVANKQARCEANAYKAHIELGYTEDYTEGHAMEFQASECLAKLVTEWFDECENYCSSCGDPLTCQQSGNEECAWNDGVCGFGERADNGDKAFDFTLEVTGGKYSEFVSASKDDADWGAQQILKEICEPYDNLWAVLVEQEDNSSPAGVLIKADVFSSDIQEAIAFKTNFKKLVTLGVSKWSAQFTRRRLGGASGFFAGVSNLNPTPATTAAVDAARIAAEACAAITDSNTCETNSACSFDNGRVPMCQACSIVACGGCASSAECSGDCDWDDGVCSSSSCFSDCTQCDAAQCGPDGPMSVFCTFEGGQCLEPTGAPTTAAPVTTTTSPPVGTPPPVTRRR